MAVRRRDTEAVGAIAVRRRDVRRLLPGRVGRGVGELATARHGDGALGRRDRGAVGQRVAVGVGDVDPSGQHPGGRIGGADRRGRGDRRRICRVDRCGGADDADRDQCGHGIGLTQPHHLRERGQDALDGAAESGQAIGRAVVDGDPEGVRTAGRCQSRVWGVGVRAVPVEEHPATGRCLGHREGDRHTVGRAGVETARHDTGGRLTRCLGGFCGRGPVEQGVLNDLAEGRGGRACVRWGGDDHGGPRSRLGRPRNRPGLLDAGADRPRRRRTPDGVGLRCALDPLRAPGGGQLRGCGGLRVPRTGGVATLSRSGAGACDGHQRARAERESQCADSADTGRCSHPGTPSRSSRHLS